MDRDSFILYIKTDDIYKYIPEDVESYELERPLPRRKNKKVVGIMKDDLDGKIMIKFVGLINT